MNFFLTSAYDTHTNLDKLTENWPNTGNHSLVNGPSTADIIVFVEDFHFSDPFYRKVLNHPLVKNEGGPPCYMYNEADIPTDVLPGLYTNLKKSTHTSQRHRPFPFIQYRNKYVVDEAKKIIENNDANMGDIQFPASFCGSLSSAIRKDLNSRASELFNHDIQFINSSQFNIWKAKPGNDDHENEMQRYLYSITRAMCVIAPRGVGSASCRVYEALMLGRYPLIISTEWVPPKHISWDKYSKHIPEGIDSAIYTLKNLTVSMSGGDAIEIAKEWDQHYGPDNMLATMLDEIEDMHMNSVDSIPRKKPSFKETIDVFKIVLKYALHKILKN